MNPLSRDLPPPGTIVGLYLRSSTTTLESDSKADTASSQHNPANPANPANGGAPYEESLLLVQTGKGAIELTHPLRISGPATSLAEMAALHPGLLDVGAALPTRASLGAADWLVMERETTTRLGRNEKQWLGRLEAGVSPCPFPLQATRIPNSTVAHC